MIFNSYHNERATFYLTFELKFLAFPVIIACTFLLFAQVSNAQSPSDHFKCGTESLKTEILLKHPEIVHRSNRLEQAYVNYMQQKNEPTSSFLMSGETVDSVLTLPVVVHIIHNNGPENISDAQVVRGIEHLNNAYANIGYYDPNTGVNTHIQFCLALRDTSNEATNGIIRHESPLTDMSTHYSHNSIVNIATWNVEDYINIRLVRNTCSEFSCEMAGYSTLPGSAGRDIDGIVMNAEYFGSSPSNSTVIIHEVGHYLGLYHTFFRGCENDDCLTDGDNVCDTPPDGSTERIACGFSLNSCKSDEDDTSANNPFRSPSLGGLGDQADPHENYMDYTASICRNQFTQGQKDRMRFFILGARSSLLRSRACLAPCKADPAPVFTVDKDSVLSGDIVTFTNHSDNSYQYKWYLNGDLISRSKDSSLQFIEPGYHTLRLEVWNGDKACDFIGRDTIIKVYCPVQADFSYEIKDDWIIFRDGSQNNTAINWTLRNGNGSVLYTSTSPIDSFEITNLLYLQLCIESNNDYCQKEHCEFIRLVRDGVEICDNQIDDDGDGYIDLYDPDCPCDDNAFQAQCPIECEYVPEDYPDFKMELAWESPPIGNFAFTCPNMVTGDIDSDGDIEILIRKTNYVNSIDTTESFILIIDGATGDSIHEFKVSGPRPYIQSRELISIADFDHDGISEILMRVEDHIRAYSPAGTLLYESDPIPSEAGRHINIADFNGDGKAEFYVGAAIFNGENGKLLCYSDQSIGKNPYINVDYYDKEAHSIAADLLPAPGLELAAGNMVYKVELNNLNDTIGNKMTPVIAEDPVKDGFTSVGDIDGDGQLDVVTVRGGYGEEGGITVWNPRTRKIIASTPSRFSQGSVPVIGDIDGDCTPEIIVSTEYPIFIYQYSGLKDLSLLHSIRNIDISGMTGATLFDFNQDGQSELVCRDQNELMIIDGKIGEIIESFSLRSATWTESPIVADIDGDGEAELLGNGYIDDFRTMRVYCFGSSDAPWAPARSVWNQPGYHVTNINDDLTVPRYPQNQAFPITGTDSCLRETCAAPYNAFNGQATLRTQQGCIQTPAFDLTLDVIDYECSPDSMIFYFIIENLSNVDLSNNVLSIASYTGIPASVPNLLHLSSFPFSADSSSSKTQISDTLRIGFPIVPGLNKIYFVINDAGTGANAENLSKTGIRECRYDNNMDSISVDLVPLSLDLGPDLVKCRSELITLKAGPGFERYIWSDGSRDSIYSSSDNHAHYLNAFDQCNREYSDTVKVIFDTLSKIDLGPDRLICKNDGDPVISLADHITSDSLDFGFIQWLPGENVDCDTCAHIQVRSDSSLSLIVLAGKDECLSTDTLYIEYRPHYTLYDTLSLCQGESVRYRDSTIANAGQYDFEINDCDSSLLLYVTVDHLDTTYLDKDICLGDSTFFGGNWFKSSGLYLETLTNAGGCDSLVYLDLRTIQAIHTYDTVTVCEQDSVYLFDQWIASDTILEQTFLSSGGCDSTQYFFTRVSPLLKDSIMIEICEGDSVQIHNSWISDAREQTIRLENADACDCLIYVNCIVHPIQRSSDSVILCQGDSIWLHKEWIYSEGFYLDTTTGQTGCDSIVETYVQYNQDPPPPEAEVDCQNLQTSVRIDASFPWRIQWGNGDTTKVSHYTNSDSARVNLYAEPNCEVEYIIDLPKLPDINSLPEYSDTSLTLDDSLTIHLNLDPAEWTISWTPGEIFTCDTCFYTQISTDQNTTVEGHFTHSSGCIYSTRFMLRVEETPKPYIPNIFTPNGDGRNDVFQVAGQNFEFLQLVIYDRWGQIIFLSDDEFEGWDGTFRGMLVSNGVYVYKLDYINSQGEKKQEIGTVTLLK